MTIKQLPRLKTTDFKGNVSVISCDPSCRGDKFNFKDDPIKLCPDQV